MDSFGNTFTHGLLSDYDAQKRAHRKLIAEIPQDRWWFGEWVERSPHWCLFRKGSSDRLECAMNASGTFRRPRELRYSQTASGLRPMDNTMIPEPDGVRLDVVLDIYRYAKALDHVLALRERLGLT